MSKVPGNTENDKTLWDTVIQTFDDFDLTNFRKIGGSNKRLGTWDPITNNSRYFKALAWEFSYYLDSQFKATSHPVLEQGIEHFLGLINPQDLGSPPTISLSKVKTSLDYLLAAEEYSFVAEVIDSSKRILEIGAGFGRTCHAIMSINKQCKYIIVDLPQMIDISKSYLSCVLSPEDFSRVEFVAAGEHLETKDIDLVMNIDSMQEMPKETAINYLRFISENSKHFFSKNTLGKYSLSCIDVAPSEELKDVTTATKMGLMTELVPLFDYNKRVTAVSRYNELFCPPGFNLRKTQRGFGQYLSYQLSLFSRVDGICL